MNDFDEAMVWKLKDVQNNKEMWKFCQEDFKQIFVEKFDRTFYNSLLNELVYEISRNNRSQNDEVVIDWVSTAASMTPEEMDGYLEWTNRNTDSNITDAWALLSPTDKVEIFNNDKSSFDNWFASLEPLELDYYMDRLTSALPLIATSNNEESELPSSIYKIDSLTVTVLGKSLAITSHDIKALEIIKRVFVNKGKLPCEHRIKSIGDTVFHTYIFKLNSKA
jgi:hypothetical protein